MLTKTTTSAIRVLLFLAERGEPGVVSPKTIAKALSISPTYMSKMAGSLAKAGILRTERGSKGGVALNTTPDQITLQSVYEACQGVIVGNYCSSAADAKKVCAFHLASVQLHQAIVGVLGRWTLAHLLERPRSFAPGIAGHTCMMLGDSPRGDLVQLGVKRERPPVR